MRVRLLEQLPSFVRGNRLFRREDNKPLEHYEKPQETHEQPAGLGPQEALDLEPPWGEVPTNPQPVPALVETNIFEAQIITSRIDGKSELHSPILDLDIPHALVPSSTPGRAHLYLGVKLDTNEMNRLVDTLVEVGILQRGIGAQWRRHGHLGARLPWVKKGEDRSWLSQQQDDVCVEPQRVVE